ncbi:hypothetical protein [Nonomuraea ceibae]|uniref:hypothetical protein n=1 Tax=Nonomuraea ceibae TaxID=1935170 RepID=UPI001C5ECBA3|nr:hypothetical protein [Nonomuraea ceibae]
MSAVPSPDADLDSACQGLEEAARDLVPPDVLVDFLEIRLKFALLKQDLGMDLTFGNRIDIALGEFRHGLPASQLGAVWQQRQDVAQAVASVGQHAGKLSTRPEWNRIRNIYGRVRDLGTTIERQLGAHGAKVLADPRVKNALKTVADLASRRIAADAWALSKVLGGAGAGLASVRQAVHWLEKAAKAGASRADEVARQHAQRRAAAATVRSSTGGKPSPTSSIPEPSRTMSVPRPHRKTRATATTR